MFSGVALALRGQHQRHFQKYNLLNPSCCPYAELPFNPDDSSRSRASGNGLDMETVHFV